ncbi:MAG TPA: rod shape-determining protein MreD [Caproicibacter sp.]|nr:rod shape-determining protein MreD [Caproicibacter sp.]
MTKYRAIRWIAYFLEIVVIFVLQETPGLIPEIFHARPVAVIPAVLSIALFESEVPSMVFGLIGGLLIDFGFGGILGFHGLILAAACFIISAMAANLFRTNFLTAVLVSLIVTALITFLQWACFYVLYGYQHTLYALTAHYLPIFCYTAVLMPITYYFNRALAMQIRSKEE